MVQVARAARCCRQPQQAVRSPGGEESCTGDDVGSSMTMKSRPYYHHKLSAWKFLIDDSVSRACKYSVE
ncbi:hypothetical protein KIN20_007311 [Parelaphostrongylus tenuis]|uniref:Uncharacterized protein n=1 Tax=Parelaphostrongylus tenuis TaxID=148309 RepID=A0AAD5QJX9_PARTN|nr:hypothetical protein KIN20_007311 [Parelaphostrongylus tenuis]